MTIELGSKVKDKHTGFTGIATSRAEYLNGCVQFGLEAVGQDGRIIDQWFDEARLEVVVETSEAKAKKSLRGGPGRTVPARTHP